MEATSCGSAGSGSEVDSNIRTIALFDRIPICCTILTPYVRTYRVESHTRLRIPHLGFKKCGDQSGHHLPQRSTPLFLADQFDGISDLHEVTSQSSLKKRTLV